SAGGKVGYRVISPALYRKVADTGRTTLGNPREDSHENRTSQRRDRRCEVDAAALGYSDGLLVKEAHHAPLRPLVVLHRLPQAVLPKVALRVRRDGCPRGRPVLLL